MNLDSLCIDPRLRSSWEAVDLGFKLARHWYFIQLVIWLVPFALVATVATTLFSDNLLLAFFITWWFKPLYDRGPLFFISRALFGTPPSVREVFRQSLSIYGFDWFSAVTWRRFSFTRSFNLSITVLERLTGDARSQRLKILHHKGSGVALALGFICVLFESCIAWGCITFISLLIPEQFDLNVINGVVTGSDIYNWVLLSMYYLALILVAPIYICAGFMLYINRRIDLEAWDVEIQFRKLANQIENSSTAVPKTVQTASKETGTKSLVLAFAASFITLLCTFAPTEWAYADQTSLATPTVVTIETPQQAKQHINSIFEGEAFNQQQLVTKWRLKSSADSNSDSFWESLWQWLEKLFESNSDHQEVDLDAYKWLALAVEIVLWIAAGLLLAWVIYRYRHNIKSLLLNAKLPSKEPQPSKPEVLFGLDVRQESLPSNVIEEVRKLNQAEQFRQALSLLYRATLTAFMTQKGVEFNDSLTENECAAIVYQLNEATTSQYTQKLTLLWQRLAYGHHPPTQNQVSLLCDSYLLVFET